LHERELNEERIRITAEAKREASELQALHDETLKEERRISKKATDRLVEQMKVQQAILVGLVEGRGVKRGENDKLLKHTGCLLPSLKLQIRVTRRRSGWQNWRPS